MRTQGKQRTKGSQRDTSKIKPKFLEQRQEESKIKSLVPMNQRQKEYIDLLATKPVVCATGYAGTSKSYVAAAYAAQQFRLGNISKIVVTRPAISTSKTVGLMPGDVRAKMELWLAPVVQVLKEFLGTGAYESAMAKGDIEFFPLENIKGMSLNDAFIICEEASDLTKDEVIKMVTRLGKNSTLVLAGDIRQAELKEESGLIYLQDMVKRHNLDELFGCVDFNEIQHIVRSDAVRRFIAAVVKDENSGKGISKKGSKND